MYYFALSHAPPALAIIIASNTPARTPPPISPAKASVQSKRPVSNGDSMASIPGKIISDNAA